jgi:hypothetical protein
MIFYWIIDHIMPWVNFLDYYDHITFYKAIRYIIVLSVGTIFYTIYKFDKKFNVKLTR